MKTGGIPALVLLCSWASPQAAPVYQESGGIVVVEIESAPRVPDWHVETGVPGFTGTAYYTWRGPNLYSTPGSGILAYSFNITTAGRYNFAVHNRPDHKFNGCFVRLDMHATQPGTFAGGWTRVFFSTPDNTWGWTTNYDVGTSHPAATFDLTAGQHTLEFSGRDAGVSLDRFHLYLSGVADPLDPRRPPSATTGSTPPPTGPSTHWRLDDGTGRIAVDSSGNGHDATLVSDPIWLAAGRVDGALMFDGVDDFLDGGTGPALTGQGPFSVLAWIQSVGSANQVIVQQRSPAGFDGEYQLGLSPAGQVRWWTFGGGAMGFDVTSTRSVNDGVWHHVAAVRLADGTGQVYLDGVLDRSQAAPSRTLAPLAVYLGADRRDNSNFFRGSLDDVRIYDRALSAAEIAALAAEDGGIVTPPPPPPGPPRTRKVGNENDPCGCGSIGGGTRGILLGLLVLLALLWDIHHHRRPRNSCFFSELP